LDHLGIGEKALEESLLILGFHLAHQNVLKFVKVELLFPDRFSVRKLVHHFALAYFLLGSV
jgi:hypothetical protein